MSGGAGPPVATDPAAAPRARQDRSAQPPERWEDWADLPFSDTERSRRPLFVERDIYRRRRIMDAARLLPALGAALLLMPMLWARDHGTGAGVVYLFLVWIGLILSAAVLERRLSEPLRDVGPRREGRRRAGERLTMAFNVLVTISLAYVAFLFAVAFSPTAAPQRIGSGWLRSPLVYTLSLSIYCTAWTFYGAVGYAARSGLEFVTIYLGPTLVFIGWWRLLRKLVRIGRAPADHLDRRPDLLALRQVEPARRARHACSRWSAPRPISRFSCSR